MLPMIQQVLREIHSAKLSSFSLPIDSNLNVVGRILEQGSAALANHLDNRRYLCACTQVSGQL